MRSKPNVNEWSMLDFSDEYTAGTASSRLLWLFDYDPAMTMLDARVRDSIANLIFSDGCLGRNKIQCVEMDIIPSVLHVLKSSPLELLFSDDFKAHIANLALVSLLGRELGQHFANIL